MQAALTRIGADVISFDDNSALPMAGMPPVGKVSQGDESQVRKVGVVGSNRDRTQLGPLCSGRGDHGNILRACALHSGHLPLRACCLHRHRRRTLLLVYPGPDDMALNALKAYSGRHAHMAVSNVCWCSPCMCPTIFPRRHLLYVGESRGGINANDAFFDLLEKTDGVKCERRRSKGRPWAGLGTVSAGRLIVRLQGMGDGQQRKCRAISGGIRAAVRIETKEGVARLALVNHFSPDDVRCRRSFQQAGTIRFTVRVTQQTGTVATC
eukprot:357773-Chlamydomonas_euryale.AAC.3